MESDSAMWGQSEASCDLPAARTTCVDVTRQHPTAEILWTSAERAAAPAGAGVRVCVEKTYSAI